MKTVNKEEEFRNINEQNKKNEETVSYSPPCTSLTLCIYLYSVQMPGNSSQTSCHIRTLQKAPIKTYVSLYRKLEIIEKGKGSRIPPSPAPTEHSGKGPWPPPAPVTTGLCSSCPCQAANAPPSPSTAITCAQPLQPLTAPVFHAIKSSTFRMV